MIDVTADAARNPDFLLTPGELRGVGAEHGTHSAGGVGLYGPVGAADHPAEFLMSARRAAQPGFTPMRPALAIDRDVLAPASRPSAPTRARPAVSTRHSPTTRSCMAPANSGSPACCNLDLLPPGRRDLIAAPLKFVNGCGSPLRVLAIAPAQAT